MWQLSKRDSSCRPCVSWAVWKEVAKEVDVCQVSDGEDG